MRLISPFAPGAEISIPPQFTSITPVTVVNEAATRSLIGVGVGNLTVPANRLTVGTVIRCTATGIISTIGVPGNLFIDLCINDLMLCISTITASPTANLNARNWYANFLVTMTNAINNAETVGNFIFPSVDAVQSAFTVASIFGGEVMDTSIPNVFDFTATWAIANPGNSLTCRQFVMEIL